MKPNQIVNTRRWRQTPQGRYSVHKAHAKRRRVEFRLTFEEWRAVWGERIDTPGLVMMRQGDEGPYAVGNVSIGARGQNAIERNQVQFTRRHTARTTTVIFSGEPGPDVPF